MKKALRYLFSVIISLSISFVVPFSIYASNEQISGFDYSNYYELEYLQFNGSSYIDTGYALFNNANFDLIFDIEPTNTNSSGGLFIQYA